MILDFHKGLCHIKKVQICIKLILKELVPERFSLYFLEIFQEENRYFCNAWSNNKNDRPIRYEIRKENQYLNVYKY